MNRSKSKSFVSNVIIILTAQIAVKLLGLIYRMVITNINGFGDVGNGYYSAGFQVYTLLLALSSVGIPSAVSKLISEKIAVGNCGGADSIFKTALFIFAGLGTVLSAGMFLFAGPIAKNLLNMAGAEKTIAALSPSVFFVCVSSVLRGYFSGINKMRIMSASQVIEQIFKSGLTVWFVILAAKQSAEIMSAFANLATTAATLLAAVFLVFAYRFEKDNRLVSAKKNSKSDFASAAGKILMIAVPISLCSVISAINRLIDTATVMRGIEAAFKNCIPAHTGAAAVINPTVQQLNAEAVRLSGLLSKSDTLINLPLALNTALATVLVPSISKCCAEGNYTTAKKYINSSFLASVVLILPCAAGYVILAKPIYSLIYPAAPLGFELLQLGSISLVFTALNQTLTGALQGAGKVYVPTAALAAGCIVKLVSNIVLIRIPQINISGAVIGSALCQITVFIIEFCSLSKLLVGKISIKGAALKPLLCCAVMGAAACAVYNEGLFISKSNFVAVLASVLLSACVYGAGIIKLRVFSGSEISKIPGFEKIYIFFEKKHIRKNNNVIK